MNSSTFVRELVLDLSKVLIYEFYLGYILYDTKWRKNVNFLYVDTDITLIKTDGFYTEL